MVPQMTWKAMRHHLLQTTKDPVPLDEPKAQLFHPIVAKLLFLCKRSWPDLSTAIAFITTRVKCPDEDDYKKLTCVMISQSNTTFNIETYNKQHSGYKMVGGCLICNTPRHAKPYRRSHDGWKRGHPSDKK